MNSNGCLALMLSLSDTAKGGQNKQFPPLKPHGNRKRRLVVLAFARAKAPNNVTNFHTRELIKRAFREKTGFPKRPWDFPKGFGSESLPEDPKTRLTKTDN